MYKKDVLDIVIGLAPSSCTPTRRKICTGMSGYDVGLGGQCLKGVFTTDRSVAYVPQQPWILNGTVRDNILFGSKFDEDRYRQTISACALDHDISQLIAGHDTEIVSLFPSS
jgi:hypothetical protein